MLFIYRIVPARKDMLATGPTDTEMKVVAEHFAYLQKLTKAGIVRLAGRTQVEDESAFGIVIFTAATEDDAMAIMNNDPAVSKGVMTSALYPFKIALENTGVVP